MQTITGDSLMAQFLAVSPEEATENALETWANRIHPEDRAAFLRALEQSVTQGQKFALIHRVLLPAGDIRWLDSRGNVTLDANNVPVALLGIAVDVTVQKRAEEALRKSEARFRAVQETSVDGFMSLESVRDAAGALKDFRWNYANDAAAKIVGRPAAWFPGKLLLEEMPGNQTEGLFDAYARVVQTGDPWMHEFTYNHEGLDAYIRLVAAKTGDGFAVSFADLTARQNAADALRESEERFRAMADNIPQLTWMTRADGWIFWYNQRWFDYTGTTLEQMQGWGWQSVHHPDQALRVREKFAEHVRSGLPWEDTFPLRGADGVYRWFLSRASPIRDAAGNIALWFGSNTDITEQRETETELRRHQAEIEMLNARLKRAMQETHHRIKNNLQVIAALVEMQNEGADAAISPTLRRINQHVHALAVIHDLLTQRAKGDAELDRVGAQSVLNRLLPMLQQTSGGRKINAEIADIILPVQQAASLSLLISECVSNAVKHGTGDIEITLRRENDAARLEVCDSGVGFPPDFDPQKAAHTGLELMDSAARWDLRGELRFENVEAGGACVVVIFPLSDPENKA